MDATDDEVTAARRAIGLPARRLPIGYGGVSTGLPIVCKCIYCGTLFGSLTHNLGDLDVICDGDCGRPWQHPDPGAQNHG
jgi:hypothetical protein